MESMIKYDNYHLDDMVLIQWALDESKKRKFNAEGEYRRMIFVPRETLIVLGKSKTTIDSVNVADAQTDGITIIQRPSGGQAVLLSPNTLVISFCVIAPEIIRSSEVFKWTLNQIIKAFTRQGIEGIEIKGTSALVVDGKKLFGCALYRQPNMLLFHGVLNVSEAPELFRRYLKHPPKATEHAQKRDHRLIVTSVSANFPGFIPGSFRSDLLEMLDEDWMSLIKV